MMRIALATCDSVPDWEVDDVPLHEALDGLGIETAHPSWTDRSVDWSRFDGCLIRTTWDYACQREAFVTWAESAAAMTRLFNPARTVRWNTCKSYLRDLEAGGIPVIPTCWIEPGETPDLATLMADRNWTRGFIKPRIGATARGTLRFDATNEGLEQATRHLESLLATEAVMVQPYLSQVEQDGEWSGIFINGEWSHAVRKIPQPGDFRVQDDFGATDEAYTPSQEERSLAQQVINLLDTSPQWTGQAGGVPLLYARVDFLRDGDQSLLTEVELVEPSLFFRHAPSAGARLAKALVNRCQAPA
ncbi:MAG: hypothetical protein MK116_04565 [Phycisphaerales bacterium]|nr:hypothetical protein [Phycisphaerales bacterium]